MLYGRFATSVAGVRTDERPIVDGQRVGVDDRHAVPRQPRTSAARGDHAGVDLDGEHLRPGLRSASVRLPRPGPTSTTRSPGATPASRTTLRTVFGSTTKFWPTVLVRCETVAVEQRAHVGPA